MKIIRGIWNRLRFLPTKLRLKQCGRKTLFESSFEVEGSKYISVGSNVRTKSRFHIAAIEKHNNVAFNPVIIIGDDVSINYDVHIAAINRIVIESGVLIASKVFITDHYHGDISEDSIKTPPRQRILYSKGPVVIGKNAWIGENVSIMPGVSIGESAIIGANAVITRDVPAHSVAAGVPAKVIKKLV